jgi:hypothetical protein
MCEVIGRNCVPSPEALRDSLFPYDAVENYVDPVLGDAVWALLGGRQEIRVVQLYLLPDRGLGESRLRGLRQP